MIAALVFAAAVAGAEPPCRHTEIQQGDPNAPAEVLCLDGPEAVADPDATADDGTIRPELVEVARSALRLGRLIGAIEGSSTIACAVAPRTDKESCARAQLARDYFDCFAAHISERGVDQLCAPLSPLMNMPEGRQ